MDYLILILILWLAFLARQAGGGKYGMWLVYHVGTRYGAWWASAAARVPEALWAITITCVSASIYHYGWELGIGVAIASYMAMEAGHGNAYHMGFEQYSFPPRHQSLDYVVLPICKHFGWENRGWQYCWLYMGLKGLLIGLPLLPAGLGLALLWPLAYYISFRNTASSLKAEWYSGTFAGVMCVLAWWIA